MRPLRRGFLLVAGGVAAALVAVGACADTTEITVHIATDLPCDAIATSVTGGRDVVVTRQCSSSTRPGIQDVGSIVLVPSAAKDDALTITVVTARGKDPSACDPKGDPSCIVARRKVRYVTRTALDLPIELRAACLGKPCDPDTTCELGACVSAQYDDPRLTAERDAGSTYDATAFADGASDTAQDAPSEASADVSVDAPLDAPPDAPPSACPAGPLVTVPSGVDTSILEVTTYGVFWVAAQNIFFRSFATGVTGGLPNLGTVSRIAASGSTIYYAPSSKGGVESFDVVTGLSGAISNLVDIAGLYAEDGAADNPFFTDFTNAYSKAGTLFGTAGATGTRAELATSPSGVWLITDTQIFLGPRAVSGTARAPFVTSATNQFRELTTDTSRVFWLSGPPTGPELDYFPIGGGAQGTVQPGPPHFGAGARAYASDLAGILYREAPGYPLAGGNAVQIAPGPVVGRIVPRASCVYFWSQNKASGSFEIRAVAP